ncbi:hypothetical protein ACLMJK_007496 [Lecanora helva]
MSFAGKNSAGGANGENAPLLANDALNDVESNDEEVTNKNVSKQSRISSWFRGVWYWILHNLVVIAIALLLLGGIIALCVYFGVMSKGVPSSALEDSVICTTPGCVLAAAVILGNLSPRRGHIDPCNDFDKFVCEGWSEKHDLRADQGRLSTGTLMSEDSQRTLRHLLESQYIPRDQDIEIESSDKQRIFTKLQDGYTSCMDEAEIKKVGSAPLLDILRNVNELFPAKRPDELFKPFHPSNNDIQKSMPLNDESPLLRTMSYLTKIGVSALLDFSIGPDDKDPDVVVPFLTALRQPGLPSKEYYRDTKLVTRYNQVIGQVLEALLKEAKGHRTIPGTWENSFSTNNADLVECIVQLESKLAIATPNTEDAEDVTKYYNPLSPEEVESLLPQIPITNLFADLAPHGYKPEKFIVGSPAYLNTLSSLLTNTSVEVLQAYFVWKTVQAYAYHIEDDAMTPLVRFNNELQGKDPEATEERWRTCIKFTDRGLGWILSNFFIEKAFSSKAKQFGDQIVSDIKMQFVDKLNNADWMSEDVRRLGIEKVHNSFQIVQKIGYPTKSPDIRNSSAVAEYYKSLNITKKAFFNNSISIAEFETRREWSALGKPTNRDEWDMTADTVNAYYNPAGNEIVFPAGIMQSPVFYDPSVPQYLSYGAFGSVSGHELSHAFDSTGRHYDETGNFTDWWDSETVQSFEAKAQCFIEQYSNFTVPNPNGKPLHINGRLTLGENIADAGGLNAAFAAWKQKEAQNAGELLPGLQDFSKEQMFFVSYASWWCGKTRPETAVNLVYRDPHSPAWARNLVSSSKEPHDTVSDFE